MGLESITQQIRQEISKLNQVLHLLEGRRRHGHGAKCQRLGEEELQRPKEQGGRKSGQGSREE